MLENIIIILVIVTFHFVGVFLSFGRIFSEYYEIDKMFLKDREPTAHIEVRRLRLILLLGWGSFLYWTYVYFRDKKKYSKWKPSKWNPKFLRFTNDDLINEYHEISK